MSVIKLMNETELLKLIVIRLSRTIYIYTYDLLRSM